MELLDRNIFNYESMDFPLFIYAASNTLSTEEASIQSNTP